jgi:hypothetical protein
MAKQVLFGRAGDAHSTCVSGDKGHRGWPVQGGGKKKIAAFADLLRCSMNLLRDAILKKQSTIARERQTVGQQEISPSAASAGGPRATAADPSGRRALAVQTSPDIVVLKAMPSDENGSSRHQTGSREMRMDGMA